MMGRVDSVLRVWGVCLGNAVRSICIVGMMMRIVGLGVIRCLGIAILPKED
jgi:hypothetical protein